MDKLELCLFNVTTNGEEGGKKIRGGKSAETGEEVWSVLDFINVVCDKELNDSYARKTFGRLIKEGSANAEPLSDKCHTLKITGRGPQETTAMTLIGLVYLLGLLEGKLAMKYRSLACSTLMRVAAGDRSLIKVIEANAESTAPLQEALRDALEHEPVDDTLEEMAGISGTKRKLTESEHYALRVQISEHDKQDKADTKAHFDFLLHEQRAGVLGMNEFNMLKRKRMLDCFGGSKSAVTQFCLTNGEPLSATLGDSQSTDWVKTHVPRILPLFIFVSAMVNNIHKHICTNRIDLGTSAPMKVRIPAPYVLYAYHHFYEPFLDYLPGCVEKVPIQLDTLVPTTDDTPAMLRLKALLLVQNVATEMEVFTQFGFTAEIKKLFPGKIIDISSANSRKYFTFTLLEVKKFLQTELISDSFDEIVDLDMHMSYDTVPTSSTIFW